VLKGDTFAVSLLHQYPAHRYKFANIPFSKKTARNLRTSALKGIQSAARTKERNLLIAWGLEQRWLDYLCAFTFP